MPTNVTLWRTVDGETFDSQAKAVKHERAHADVKIKRLLAAYVESRPLPEASIDEILALAPLLSYQLRGRSISWQEVAPEPTAEAHPATD